MYPFRLDIEGEISPYSWFEHILPQLQGRNWYGESVKLMLQSPGDTLFIPSRAPHAVINLDWSIGRRIVTNSVRKDRKHQGHKGT